MHGSNWKQQLKCENKIYLLEIKKNSEKIILVYVCSRI